MSVAKKTRNQKPFIVLVHLQGISWQKSLVHYPHRFFAIGFSGSKVRQKNRKGSMIWMAGDCSTVRRWQWRPSLSYISPRLQDHKMYREDSQEGNTCQLSICVSKWWMACILWSYYLKYGQISMKISKPTIDLCSNGCRMTTLSSFKVCSCRCWKLWDESNKHWRV